MEKTKICIGIILSFNNYFFLASEIYEIKKEEPINKAINRTKTYSGNFPLFIIVLSERVIL